MVGSGVGILKWCIHTLLTLTLGHSTTVRDVTSPWVRPTPKQHAYLLFGFTLARANARMLINAASKRSSAKNAVRTSRSRSTRMVAETE